ncbi:o-succinylbenzoate--CoA ligase [Ureibacillus chungkukjangi]|uniref:2-succinylbenzoate--CoA ligase n=1 Tax=Ureibacillus chungkukjangi TaxID=1202712 RepID=A0A318U1K6_9BACL|nr:o-succinylbenzoate--CoA ligase [Ureibacillus chungkukjangi]PYF09128.1 2-succinylbenzoyl-CoA synthetase [Ureibacillus chungkukjangi]
MYPNWILQRAQLTPARRALSFEEQSWTFEELKNISVKRATQLTALGIKPKERVAILGPSEPSLIFMMYACMHLQCEMVMLNRKLSKVELQYQIEDAQVEKVLVADEDALLLPDIHTPIVFSAVESTVGKSLEISKEWSLDQTVTIMYTSGTTGLPKGVRQTVGNHQASALASVLNIGLSEEDVWLCTVPLFHISGFSILVRSLLYGNAVKLYKKFDKDQAALDIAEGQVTHMSAVAVMLQRVLQELEDRGLEASPKFKMILAGGGPVPENYIKRAHRLNLMVSQTYGMTETSSQTATLSNEDALRKLGSAGKPLFFNQIKIAGVASPGEMGEILIRGPHVTPGYIGSFSERSSTVDGWLHTGDIGYLDEEGYLFVVDRRSDLLISGGENIYPAEIENVLLSHQAVGEAGVCAIDDETWGQVPVAFIVLKEDVREDELIEFCKERLAKYKVPKYFHVVPNLPRSGSDKLLRRKLKDLLN